MPGDTKRYVRIPEPRAHDFRRTRQCTLTEERQEESPAAPSDAPWLRGALVIARVLALVVVATLCFLLLTGCNSTGHEVDVGGSLGPSLNLGWKGPKPQGDIRAMVDGADWYEFEVRGGKGQAPAQSTDQRTRVYPAQPAVIGQVIPYTPTYGTP